MITSTSNPRIKAARKLQRSRHRRQQQRLLIEGVRLAEDAWRAGVQPDALFVDPQRLAGSTRGLDLAARMTAAGVPRFDCAPHVFAELCETVTPQGIALVTPWPSLAAPAHPTLVLVLDRVRDPGNAGTLMRTAEAAGVDLAIFGPETVDPFNDKVLRAAMGAHFRLPLRTCAIWADVTALLPGGATRYVADAHADRPYDEADWCDPSVLIIGGEAAGPSAEARVGAAPLAIPLRGDVESLNAAVAGAVILFEAARQRRRRQGEG